MRRELAVVCALALACCGPSLGAEEREPVAVAQALVEHLAAGKFVEAAALFDEQMLAALPATRLEATWRQLQRQLGPLQRRGDPASERQGQYTVVFVPCIFERAALDAKVAVAADGRVAGLFFVPSVPRG